MELYERRSSLSLSRNRCHGASTISPWSTPAAPCRTPLLAVIQPQMRIRTPTVIALSATLKLGQAPTDTKSTTYPSLTRSIRLPNAPPVIKPIASVCQSGGRCCRKSARKRPPFAIDATVNKVQARRTDQTRRHDFRCIPAQPAIDHLDPRCPFGQGRFRDRRRRAGDRQLVDYSDRGPRSRPGRPCRYAPARSACSRSMNGLALDAVGNIGERFEPLFADRFPQRWQVP